MPPDLRYPLDPNDPTLVNDPQDWREMWLADITRLEDYVSEMEEKGEVDNEFWRMMHSRLYRAFAPDPMYPPPPMHPHGGQMDAGMPGDEVTGDDDKEGEVDADMEEEDA